MKKRIFSILLCLCMIATLLPVGAMAASEHGEHATDWTAVTAETDAITQSGNYYLNEAVTRSNTIAISGDNVEVTLCLNGKTLSCYYNVISVASGATLNLCDCGTGGKVECTGYNNGVYNSGTLYVSDSVSVTSSSDYGVYNYGTLYLSGTPTISGGNYYGAIYCSSSAKIYANNGATTPEYYSGSALNVSLSSYTLGAAAIYGVNETNKGSFTLKNTNYRLAEGTDGNAGNLVIRGAEKNLSWYAEDGTTPLTGDGYPTVSEYGASVTTAQPVKEGLIFVGWLYSTDDGSTWKSSVWKASDTVSANTAFKALYVPVFSGGAGTAETPYQISTPAQLQGLATLVNNGNTAYNGSNVYYKLTAALDLAAVCGSSVGSWTPIGNGSYNFKAHFDGGGKTVSGLYINNTSNYQGLFGYIYGASVKDLTLTGVSVVGGTFVGGVVGRISYGSITGCTVTGAVSGYNKVGATVGENNYNYATVSGNTETGCAVTVLPPSGYTTDANRIMAYSIDVYAFDVRGFYKGEWIKTEFSDSYDIACEGLRSYSDVATTAGFINDGRYVQLNFTVTAPSGGIANGKLAVDADVQIGGNDYAAIEVIQNTDGKVVGLKMVDDKNNSPSYEAQFNLYFAEAGGVTDVDTYWFGAHSDETTFHFDQLSATTKSSKGTYVTDGGLETKFSGADSGLAFSWQNINLAAGESKTYSVIIGIGEKSDPPQWSGGAGASPISLTQDAGQPGQAEPEVKVGASVAHVEGQTHSLYYDVDGGVSEKLNDFTPGNETTPDTILSSLPLADLAEGDHTLRFWVVNSSGAATPAVTKEITVDASGAITSGLDGGSVPVGPEAPAFENTIDVDNSSNANFYFTTEYAEAPTVRAYTSADGNELTAATVSPRTYGISVNGITNRTELWVCVVVEGAESARVKITVLPQYTPVDGSAFGNGEQFVNTTTAAGLGDYLNYCEPDCVSVSGSTVTLLKDVTLFHSLTLKTPEITLNLSGNTLVGSTGTGTALSVGEGTVTAVIKDGAIETGSACVISHAAGSLTLSNVDVTGAAQGVVTGKDLTLTDGSTITIVTPAVSGVTELESSMALAVTGGENVKLVNATIANQNTGAGHYTYYGFDPGQDSPAPPTLASCIDAGSETTASSQLIDGFEVCSETITVAISDPNAPPAWVTSAITSPDDYEYAGTAPKALKLLDDVSLAAPLAPTEDVTIDLNGHTITGAPGQNAIAASGKNITITDTSAGVKGSVTGGSGATSGNGGDAISGGNVTVTGGASVVGGNGGSGSATGGNGGDGVNTTGAVTIERGGAAIGGTGGSGTGSGAGGSGGIGVNTQGASGDVTVNGAVTGGNGGDGGASDNAGADGGSGGAGVNIGSGATLTGTGTVTGGNGGNIPDSNTLGAAGAAGEAVTGGSAADGLTVSSGKKGVKVNVDITAPVGADAISVPIDKVADAAVTKSEIDEAEADNKTITVNLTVTPSTNESGGRAAIQNAVGSQDATFIFIEVKLEKVLTPSAGGDAETTAITEANALIPFEIRLDAASSGKAHYAVLRQHGGDVDTLTETPNAEGEHIAVNAAKTVITVYAKKFSTYAIVFSNAPITPAQPATPGVNMAPAPQINAPENGTVALSPKYPGVGSTVTVTATPDEGYAVDTVTVVTSGGAAVAVTDDGNGKYTFTQPVQKVTITVTFRPASRFPFTDVKETDWFYGDVAFASAAGLMQGTSDTTFDPHGTTTRGMLVTILYRLEGEPAVTGACPFDDVTPGKYYERAVIWAAANGIVDGYGNGKFGPDDDITREQMAAALWRYAKYKGYDVSASADLSKFIDEGSVSGYARTALSWANASELINGKGGGILDPKGNAERCQAAALLHRFCVKNAE